MNQSHLLCIISAHIPYKYDLNSILALPDGAPYRARWREKWVQPELRARIQANNNSKKMLLILRDPESERLFPLRWVNITRAQKISTVYFFEYSLKEYVFYPDAEKACIDGIDAFNSAFRSHHQEYFVSNADSKLFVFESPIIPEISNENAEDGLTLWGRIVRTVSQIETLKGDEFLKIVSIEALGKKKEHVSNGYLQLNTKSLYSLSIFQLIPHPHSDPPPQHSLELRAPEEHITILRTRQVAVGKYDTLTFLFRTLNLPNGAPSFLDIKQISNMISTDDPPSIYLPVYVKRRMSWKVVFKFIGTLASLWFIMKPTLPYLSSDFIHNLAIISLILFLSDKLDYGKSLISQLPKFK